jgi:pimeloyl-ACP methyl ester carboxylesterase
MKTMLRLTVSLVALLLSIQVASPARAESPPQVRAVPGECQEGVLPGGALSMFCVPARGWNGDLVVWAHGYVAFNEPLDFQHLEIDGVYLPNLVQRLGYAFATTSYRVNGLAILQGSEDIRELVAAFPGATGVSPNRTYLTGASEGGIITTLLVEQSPDLFSGGLSACGPTGDFRRQLDYFGDFGVLFRYFFPGVIPGSSVEIPAEVIENWHSQYAPAVRDAITQNPVAAAELVRVARAPIDPEDPTTIESTIMSVLWYNVFATNDGIQKLGGNPFDNRARWYRGSSNDLRLNARVERYAADPAALAEIERYQTTGNLTRPLVVLHTTGDEIIPAWHMLLYARKANPSGEGRLTSIPIVRYGHCEFTAGEMLVGFGALVRQVTGQALPEIDLSE